MSYTRIAAMLTAGSAYVMLQLHRPTEDRVEMHPTKAPKEPSVIQTYSFLKDLLSEDRFSSHIFKASLQRQTLTNEQALILATLAIKHAHVVGLDALAEKHPDTITPQWVQETIAKEGNRFTYSALLRKNANDQVPHLSYLFDTKNEMVIVEERDTLALCEARLYAKPHTSRIVTVNTEPYDPSYKIHT